MRISDWSSDVCSSDLKNDANRPAIGADGRDDRRHDAERPCTRSLPISSQKGDPSNREQEDGTGDQRQRWAADQGCKRQMSADGGHRLLERVLKEGHLDGDRWAGRRKGRSRIIDGRMKASPGHHSDSDDDPDENEERSEEHTSELQSLMRISYAVFCLKKK